MMVLIRPCCFYNPLKWLKHIPVLYKLNTLLVSLCSKKIIKVRQSNPTLWMPAYTDTPGGTPDFK